MIRIYFSTDFDDASVREMVICLEGSRTLEVLINE